MFSVLVQQYAAVTSAHMSLELLLGQPLPFQAFGLCYSPPAACQQVQSLIHFKVLILISRLHRVDGDGSDLDAFMQ